MLTHNQKEYVNSAYKSYIERIDRRGSLLSASNYFQKLIIIADYYEKNLEKIISHNQQNKHTSYCAYAFNWAEVFTPIEFDAWCSIRAKGRIVLYPQFPVLNYHIDFANPVLKIGIELDGKQYHDAEKDYLRDKQLNDIGWKIYRISGTEMSRKKYEDWNNMEQFDLGYVQSYVNQVDYWLSSTGDGIIEAIKAVHFDSNIYSPNDELYGSFLSMCHKTLHKHSNF